MTQDNTIIVAVYGGLDIGHGATVEEARGFVRGMVAATDGMAEADETLRHTRFARADSELAALVRAGQDPGPLEIVGGVARCEAAKWTASSQQPARPASEET